MTHQEFAVSFEKGLSATKRFLLAHGASLQEAEELAQAAWVRGWEYREQLRDAQLLGFWVNSIARNLFRAKFRRLPDCQLPMIPHDFETGLYASLELGKVLKACSKKDRKLLLAVLEGQSTKEIAIQNGITPTGIRVRLLRVRNELREKLGGCGCTTASHGVLIRALEARTKFHLSKNDWD